MNLVVLLHASSLPGLTFHFKSPERDRARRRLATSAVAVAEDSVMFAHGFSATDCSSKDAEENSLLPTSGDILEVPDVAASSDTLPMLATLCSLPPVSSTSVVGSYAAGPLSADGFKTSLKNSGPSLSSFSTDMQFAFRSDLIASPNEILSENAVAVHEE